MNHAEGGGGCCSAMGSHGATTADTAGTVDHSKMNHDPAAQVGEVDHSKMNHEMPAAKDEAKPMAMAMAGCCAGMAGTQQGHAMPNASNAEKPGAGCCGNMAASTKEPAAAAAPPAAEAAPKAPGVMSGCPTTADAPAAKAAPGAPTAAAGCCAGHMGPMDHSK